MTRTPIRNRHVGVECILALPLLLGTVLAVQAAAQATPPVFYFSTTTGTFDGLMPIGKSFQIKGVIPTNLVAVRAESFGFASGRIPPGFAHKVGDLEFCSALNASRANVNRDIVVTNLGWERSTPSITEFTLNHPRLYYGRNYVFAFTYFTPVDPVVARKLLAEGLRQVVETEGDFDRLLRNGLTGADLDREVISVIRANQVRGCGPLIVRRDLQESFEFWKLTRDSLLSGIAQVATRKQREQSLAASAPGAKDQLRSLESGLPENLAANGGVQDALTRARAATDSGKWAVAAEALESLRRLKVPESLLDGPLFLAKALAGMQQTIDGLPKGTPEAVAAWVAERYRPEDLQELMVATSVRPYSQTMREAFPFLIPLDGGLAYVRRFRQLMPALAVNIKLRRIDFDDPLDKRAEFSFLLGVTATKPDDLDPDFAGIFNGSDRALLLTLGVRSPCVSSLLRFQAGVLVFRQHDANPISHDLHTSASFVWGLSMNWDALDFAATLIRGRPTLGAGGF